MPIVNKDDRAEALKASKIVAIIRIDDASALVDVVRALVHGGITAVEIALNSPGALAAIATSVAEVGDRALIGAGTVLNAESAEAAIDAGASFVLSPVFRPDVLAVCQDCGAMCIPGAYTPSEIYAAWEAGADFVKIFPASKLGPSYIKDILAPLPQVRLAPVGGVGIDSIGAYLEAGASFVGIGSRLFPPELVTACAWDEISATAARFVKAAVSPGPS